MIRVLLATNGSNGSEDPDTGPLPLDPTLNTWRPVTTIFSMNQNTRPVQYEGGETVKYPPVKILEDCNGMTLVFSGGSQGAVVDVEVYVSLRFAGGTEWYDVTWGGQPFATFTDTTDIESDLIERVFQQNETFEMRVYMPSPQRPNVGNSGDLIQGRDARHEDPFVKTYEFGGSGPMPIVFNGKARASVKSYGIFGDSISAAASWFNGPVTARGAVGINFGRNVQRFDGRWLTPMSMKGMTHMLVQFGVNDLNGTQPETVVQYLWGKAKACYEYVEGLRSGIVIYQTTPTPIVYDNNNDGCATLAGQGDEARKAPRLVWVAWQRDGMPFDPATGLAVGVGEAGTRIGQPGHPVKGLVDMAAATEHGGVEAPSGKWRVDTGPLGGDGTHPNDTGVMYAVIEGWLDSLTV